MSFRPKYCANCGEKIERAEWGIFTSRRFCSVCEIELKEHELIPRVIVGLAGVIGIFGFGSYLNSGTLRPATDDSPKQLRRFVDQNEPAARKLEDLKGHSSTVDRSPQLASVVEPTQKPPDEVVAAKVPSQKVVTVEQGYTCGA